MRCIGAQYELLLHDEHPFLQELISLATLTDPEALANPKSPFNIYKKLKEALQTEPLIAQIPQQQRVKIGDEEHNMGFNLGRIREWAARAPYTFQDLAKVPKQLIDQISGIDNQEREEIPIPSNSLMQLFDRLEARIHALPEEEQEAAIREVRSLCNDEGSSLERLKEQVLGAGKVIPTLLAQHGEADQPISITLFYFHAILKAILSQSPGVAVGAWLSPRESMLLRFAGFIQACETGQADAIEQYYLHLPPNLQPVQRQSQLSTLEEQIEAKGDSLIQEALNDAIAEELMVGLLGSTPEQLAHHILYVKNRFHRQIGLKHLLTFDRHTGVLVDPFIGTSSKSKTSGSSWTLSTTFIDLLVALELKRTTKKFDFISMD
jgi:hypothetical protein